MSPKLKDYASDEQLRRCTRRRDLPFSNRSMPKGSHCSLLWSTSSPARSRASTTASLRPSRTISVSRFPASTTSVTRRCGANSKRSGERARAGTTSDQRRTARAILLPRRKYQCPDCVRENKGSRRGGRRVKSGDGFSAARKAALARKLKDNPKCATCGERLRKGKTHKRRDGRTSQYWKRCVNGCAHTGQESEQQFNQLSVEELLPIVYKVLARHNGHDPQDTPDIAQTIALDLHRGVLKPADLHDRERIRCYIDEQKRFSADGRRTLDLDAPVGDDSKMTYADAKPAPAAECDPHQQLEAKEAVEARLREQPADPVPGVVHVAPNESAPTTPSCAKPADNDKRSSTSGTRAATPATRSRRAECKRSRLRPRASRSCEAARLAERVV